MTTGAIAAYRLLKNTYEQYVAEGMPFASWNAASTTRDETFGTFMTLAYRFCWHAENSGRGYREPIKRMLLLLQTFDSEMAEAYARHLNTQEAELYRATLMVAAISYAFDSDLRSEFRNLGFPVDDANYQELLSQVP